MYEKIILFYVSLLITGFHREINKKLPAISLVAFSSGIGFLIGNIPQLSKIKIYEINQFDIIQIMYSIIVMKSLLQINWFIIKNYLIIIAYLSLLVQICTMIIIVLILQYLERNANQLKIQNIIQISLIITLSNSDSLLNFLESIDVQEKIPKSIFNIAKGESTFNIIIGILLFQFLEKPDINNQFLISLVQFIISIILSMCFALIFGFFTNFWIKKIIKDDILSIILQLSFLQLIYLSFDNFYSLNSIVGIFTLGTYMNIFNKAKLYFSTDRNQNFIFQFLEFNAQSIICFGVGLIAGQRFKSHQLISYLQTKEIIIFILIFAVKQVVRLLLLFAIKKTFMQVTFNNIFLLPQRMKQLNAQLKPINMIYLSLLNHNGLLSVSLLSIMLIEFNQSQILFYVFFYLLIANQIQYLLLKAPILLKRTDIQFQRTQNIQTESEINFISQCLTLSQQKLAQNDSIVQSFAYLIDKEFTKKLIGETDLVKILKEKLQQQQSYQNKSLLFQDKSIRFSELNEQLRQKLIEKKNISLIQETRIYMLNVLKKLFQYYIIFLQKYQSKSKKQKQCLCSIDAYKLLLQSLELSIQKSLEEEFQLWELISEYFFNKRILAALFKWSNNIPILGSIIQKQLVKQIIFIYEVYEVFVQSLQELVLEFQKLTKQSMLLTQNNIICIQMQKEIQSEIRKCNDYIFHLINEIPQILIPIQNCRLANEILSSQRKIAIKNQRQGIISKQIEKIYTSNIDHLILQIENAAINKTLQWEQPKFQDILSNSIDFALLTPEQKNLVLDKCNMESLQQNVSLIEKGKYCDRIYIIIKGMVHLKQSNQFQQQFGIGKLLTYSNLILSSNISLNTAIVIQKEANFQTIPKYFFQQIMLENEQFQQYIFQKAFIELIDQLEMNFEMERNKDQLQLIHQFKNSKLYIFHQLSSNSHLIKLKSQEKIQLSFGGFLFEGALQTYLQQQDLLNLNYERYEQFNFIKPNSKMYITNAQSTILSFQKQIFQEQDSERQSKQISLQLFDDISIEMQSKN